MSRIYPPIICASPPVLCRAASSTNALAPQRWLPVPTPSPSVSPSPRRGWQAIERWKEKSNNQEDLLPSGQSCTSILRTLVKAQHRPDTQHSFWRKAASRGGDMVMYLNPGEVCQYVTTLANVRLRWERDVPSTKGLQKFASHVANEIGSYSPNELSEFLWAMACLKVRHEDLLQSYSRMVGRIVRIDRGRLNNEATCRMLSAYHKLGVVDEAAMRSLSRLLCRRLIREPLQFSDTASIVISYAGLRVRDLALFNATTLALTKRGALESLEWTELAGVSAAYASLRLHSESLFKRINKRLWDSAGISSEDEDVTDSESQNAVRSLRMVRDQLSEPHPLKPKLHLPANVVELFLETRVHLEQLSAKDLAPLLPHLAHSQPDDVHGAGAKPAPMKLAMLVAVALSKGGHVWPWLWRRVVSAFGDHRLPHQEIVNLLIAMRMHLERLEPMLLAAGGSDSSKFQHDRVDVPHLPSGSGRRRKAPPLGVPQYTPLVDHLVSVSRGLAKLWISLKRRSRGLGDEELQEILRLLPPLLTLQSAVSRVVQRGRRVSGNEVFEAPLTSATESCIKCLGIELVRRGLPDDELEALFKICSLKAKDIHADVKQLSLDTI